MKKLVYSLAVLAAVLFSCQDRDDELPAANIRINNLTNSTFNLLEIVPDSPFYEAVPADAFSEYLPFDTAFEAMRFTIETDSANFTYTPPDQVFDPLPIGLYTYQVSIDTDGEVVLTFRID